MTELVLYRKYRPSDFHSIIGQEHVIQTLTHALLQKNTAHAYLFAGPKGTGKTSIARIFAKTINCAHLLSHNGNPCHRCDSCVAIEEKKVLDIIEIDAASNRGIDEIRELRESARFAPTQLSYKVYIIDEAHQLTTGAYNALLKIMEEPPAHAIFILATTAADKIPETVLSRVQRFDFKKFTIAQVSSKLKNIVEKEKIKIDEEALRMIAENAEGSMRDAESMLSQVCAFATTKITAQTLEHILGMVTFTRVYTCMMYIQKNDLKNAMHFLYTCAQEGIDAKMFLKLLIQYIRHLLLLSLEPGLRSTIFSELTEDQFQIMLDHTRSFERGKLTSILMILVEAYDMTSKTPIAFLPLELAFVRIMTQE